MRPVLQMAVFADGQGTTYPEEESYESAPRHVIRHRFDKRADGSSAAANVFLRQDGSGWEFCTKLWTRVVKLAT